MTPNGDASMKYTDREIAASIDGETPAQERARRRMAAAFDDTTTPPAEPLDMAEHTRLFEDAARHRMAAALGGEMPEHLRGHAEVIEAQNAYAAALRQAYPATYKDDQDLTWAARNKRSELIKEHQFSSGYTDEVLARVAESFRTAAQALNRPAPKPAPTTNRAKAAEATPGRRIVRITEQGRPTQYPTL